MKLIRSLIEWVKYGLLPDYKCLVFHMDHWRIVQEFSPAERKLRCDKCQSYWAMHDGRRAVLPWDKDIEELYASVLGYGRTIK